ncbi:MAG: hypothetical protein IT435_09210 [Phycisphaerales bacterium]|nr:hypothetical protein [Phycisphaerales bacterium]
MSDEEAALHIGRAVELHKVRLRTIGEAPGLVASRPRLPSAISITVDPPRRRDRGNEEVVRFSVFLLLALLATGVVFTVCAGAMMLVGALALVWIAAITRHVVWRRRKRTASSIRER